MDRQALAAARATTTNRIRGEEQQRRRRSGWPDNPYCVLWILDLLSIVQPGYSVAGGRVASGLSAEVSVGVREGERAWILLVS